jgi:hypothetical protein
VRHRFVVACLALAASLLAASCGVQCRGIDVRELDLACNETLSPLGELHFDSAASFDTFLRQQCLFGADPASIDAIVESVDFTTEAVFVAVNLRAEAGRCLVDRELDGVQVCTEGLKLGFIDEASTDVACGGVWTVAFVLDRGDLRAALATSSTL